MELCIGDEKWSPGNIRAIMLGKGDECAFFTMTVMVTFNI